MLASALDFLLSIHLAPSMLARESKKSIPYTFSILFSPSRVMVKKVERIGYTKVYPIEEKKKIIDLPSLDIESPIVVSRITRGSLSGPGREMQFYCSNYPQTLFLSQTKGDTYGKCNRS